MAHELKRFVLLEAPVNHVWLALTKSSELQNWFCEKAEIEIKEDGAFFIESRIPNATGKHRVTAVEEGRVLRFNWMISDYATKASLTLESFRGATRLVVHHEIPDDFPTMESLTDTLGTVGAGLDYLWCYAFVLLKSYLRDEKTQLRLKEHEKELGIEWQITIGADAPTVFKALTEPARIKQWNPYSGEVKVDPEQGGRYSFGWKTEEEGKDGPDQIIEFEEDRLLSYSWHGQIPQTVVTWSIQPGEGGQTTLHFEHKGFLSNPKIVFEYKLGWAHFLYGFKMYCELKQSMNEWNGTID